MTTKRASASTAQASTGLSAGRLDDIELVRSRDDVREVAQQPEEGVDLCIRQASEHTHLGLAQHAIDLGEEVVGCDQAQPAVADGVE